MKKFTIFILALLPLMAFVPVRKALPESAKGETHYAVHYNRGAIRAKMATATLTLDEGTWQEKPAYYGSFSVRAANVFKLFLLNEYKVRLFLSKDDMQPYYYTFPHKKKGKQHQLEFFYRENEVESILQIEDYPEPTRKVYPAEGKVTMEVASFAFFLRCLDPAALRGEPLRVNLLLASECVPSELKYLGQDKDYWPGEAAHHYVIKMLSRGLMENGAGNEIHVWISPEPERMLRGLQVVLGKGFVSAQMVLPEK